MIGVAILFVSFVIYRLCCRNGTRKNQIALTDEPTAITIQMAGNETSVQDIDEDGNDKKLNLSLGDSNIKGMETEGNDNKDIA